MSFFNRLHHNADWGFLALRLAVGAIFLYHGIQKWALWGAAPEGMSQAMVNLMKFLSIVEPLGGLALILGFLTEFAAFGLALIMIGAIVWIKMQVMKVPFASPTALGWEFDLALLGGCISLLFSGAGKISLDHFWQKK